MTMKAAKKPRRAAAAAVDRVEKLRRKARQIAQLMVDFPEDAPAMAPVFNRLLAEIDAAEISNQAAAAAAAYLEKQNSAAA